jgi:hypothetical protein
MLKCLWVISVPSEYRILFKFINIEYVEYDVVEVYDGKSVKDPSIVCGHEPFTRFITTSNFMMIKFNKHFGNNRSRFLAQYMTVDSSKLI